ncbi:serine hydrolase domain-containing protein [Robertkochia flava]|uniref:serine hydrolase domain-containing protein n=1 Tax=Robertkochia flava TaxID=3447986 RepID=UPI001CCAFD4F|nr:serine hydrolase domain-containing protein [Robertkochia marina]
MRFIKYIIIVSILVSCGRSQKPERGISGGENTAPEARNADDYLSALADMGQFNGVVVLENNGKILLHKAYTTEKFRSESLAVDTLSQFDLRSVSKLMAKAVLFQLEKEGKLDLSAPLATYLDGFSFGDRVSVQQLMDHRSGLPRELSGLEEDPIDLTASEVMEYVRSQSLEFDPGTDTLYSNPGYQILYYLIGTIEGKPYPEVLRERFFDPLQMNGSGAHFLDKDAKLSHYAYGHYLKNDSLIKVDPLEKEDMQLGHLFSTAGDMSRFMRSLRSSPLADRLSEDGIITHSGGSKGKRAWVSANVKNDFSIVFLSNMDMLPFEMMTKDLVAIMEGDTVDIPQPVQREMATINANILKAYEGRYDFVDAGHLVLEFRIENDSLVAYQKGKRAGVLKPESDSIFFWAPESRESIEFRMDSQGELKAYMDFQGVRWEGEKIQE